MLDRASTFAQPEIVNLLKSHFVPVAIDQANQRRQKDAEGEFYRKIASQRLRISFQSTTQGFYIATPDGKLLLYNNNRHPEKLLRLMKQELAEFESTKEQSSAKQLNKDSVDSRYSFRAPENGLIIRVHAKILEGYEPTNDRWKRIFQTSLSRDNLWVTEKEHQALVAGRFPETLLQRIARFHLVDNTRGEPPMWKPAEIREAKMTLESGRLRGNVRLASESGDRGYEAELLGEVGVDAGKVVRLDAVCLGRFWGEGPYTRGAPPGKFPLAISFTLADGTDIADGIQPQGSRGWLDGYLK